MRRNLIRWGAWAAIAATLVTVVPVSAGPPPTGFGTVMPEPGPLAVIPVQHIWTTYVNPTYGTSISYPANVFTQSPDSPQGNDFIRFNSRDGRADFYISSSASELPRSLDDIYADTEAVIQEDKQVRVTYRKKENNWFVLNGYYNDKEFFRKTVLADDGLILGIFQINFPKDQRDRYNEIRVQMSRSFQPVLNPRR